MGQKFPPEIWHEILADVVSSYLDLAITEPPLISEEEAQRIQRVLQEVTKQRIDWDEWAQHELSQPVPMNTIQPLLAVSHQFRLTTFKSISEALGPAALDSGGLSADIWNGLRRARTAYRAARVQSPVTPRPVFTAPTPFLALYTSFMFSQFSVVHANVSLATIESALWRRLFCRVLNFTCPSVLKSVERGRVLHDDVASAVEEFLQSERLQANVTEWLENAVKLRDSIQRAVHYDPVHLPSELIQPFRFSHFGWRIASVCRPPLSTYAFPPDSEPLQREVLALALELTDTWTEHEARSSYYSLK
ncbi:hypothetical protein DFH09DRAFT_1159695 [Mycena vulgaris]|nr:hypothetical protein DFH09DRAFT_1159695 [Mycena vulgaris]